MEPRENCESGGEVTTKSECEKAAEDLGLTFVRDGNWSFAQRYCLIYKNRVYFNRNTGKAPDSMRHESYRAICVENPGELVSGRSSKIWVRFPRTGILAKMWSFFKKSKAFV